MLIVFKIILVAFAVFGQAKLFPEHSASAESSLDSLVLPVDKPELALAHRAMEAQGLCASADQIGEGAAPGRTAKPAKASAADSAGVPQADEASGDDLATNCF
ncbi:MAG TPA: hypothetical protein VJ385_05765 [Fibrobacteria bacterium]|nr:hypothetical protein [Fibrobacteria bacterium]